MNCFNLRVEEENPPSWSCFLFPLASPWRRWAGAFVWAGVRPGNPAALRFSLTHNINHFIEVGQILLEICLTCGGTDRTGGRRPARKRRTNGSKQQEADELPSPNLSPAVKKNNQLLFCSSQSGALFKQNENYLFHGWKQNNNKKGKTFRLDK